MGKTLDRLLKLAESQKGYTEKNNDKDLDTTVGSTAGNGNHTKYARDLAAMGLPGYCGSAWCAVYQMWLEVKITGVDKALKTMGPQFYNCFAVRDYAKSQGRWIAAGERTPKAGYLVIFRQSHMARITKVSGNKIYTNEGNTSNGTAVVRNGGMVCNKSYELSDNGILGYVVVEYPDTQEPAVGWIEDVIGWWYRHDDGSYTKDGWEQIDGKWYFFDTRGYMEADWIRWKDKWYYCDTNSGAMVTGLQVIGGKCYYFDGSGAMAIGSVTLVADSNGVLY